MILDIARLLLFPALMAFAAASDLFTMTISNRVSLALAAGFLALALLSGMGLYDILSHVGAGAAVLAVAFACFTMGWVGVVVQRNAGLRHHVADGGHVKIADFAKNQVGSANC